MEIIKMTISDKDILSLSDRVLSEQLCLISQQIKSILVIVLVISSLTTFTLWSIVPHKTLLTWLVLVNFPSVLRLILFYVQRKHDINLTLLSIINIFLAAFSGTAWGAVGFFFPMYGDATTLLFITVVLFGVTSGSVPGLSSFVPCYFAFAIPVMSGLAFRYFSVNDEMNISAGIFCIIFLFINLAFSLVIQKSLLLSIRLRFENSDLVKNLRLEKDKAIAASHAKSTFLAAASHDLRQPLHAMGFFIESLKKNQPNEKQSQLLQKIERTSDNLRGQLNALLDISKIDAGIITPFVSPLALGEIFNKLKNEFAPLAQEKNITINILPVSWIIESDPHMIDRILNNLMSNAIRYTDNGGKILLGCRKRNGALKIEIYDTGIGIPNNLMDEVFTEYYQINNPERNQNKGLGLGLSIVKGMCDLLHHKINVTSTVGKGTCFQITVPLSNRFPILAEKQNHKFDLDSQTGNIILIDDETDTLDAMSHLIGKWGHTVLPFEAEQDVLKFLNENEFMPDIIITDFRLREMRTGAQAIDAINNHYNKSIPAIIITGDTAKDRMLQARESGHILLHKPIMPASLRTIINNTLQKELN